ncbi:S8 family serine peptidase [Flavobacterium sp. NST-5]|uniref:S8 family serine peptidase n=1 Tax=Flavobacterium ichthyis TaxID=2698827 RepID=A0ABW9Z6W7_9FLAO|nr:S8 family serine peptidase [Flavobacterium ichthyis]NBL64404.1 S8 family serine peptidase [Flavobacterium ichthyis]
MKKILFLLLISSITYAQTKEELKKIVDKTDIDNLNILSDKLSKEYQQAQERINDFLSKNPEYSKRVRDGFVIKEIYDIDNYGHPLYNVTFNRNAAVTARANALYTGGSLGLDIEGQNMTAGIWDGGAARVTHNEFQGRVFAADGAGFDDHATHVTGTIIAAGLNPLLRGLAFRANARSYDWNSDSTEMASAAAGGLLVSNHSYGPDASSLPLWMFGAYDSRARSVDQITFAAPYYLPVTAAGNDRDSYAIYNPTKDGYDLIAGFNTAKNFLTVGAVNQVLNYTGPSSITMSNFSNWGPTDDGRIKPEVVTKGVSVRSTLSSSDTDQGVLNGTSMASPGVAGTALLLQQYYNSLNGNYMRAATLKGLIMHSADEAGLFEGPDYRHGWGLINAERAATIIRDKGVSSIIDELSLLNTASYTFDISSFGSEPLMLSISWTDRPATSVNTGTNDPSTLYLVNDLDVRITKDGTTYYPWTLNPSNPSAEGLRTEDNFRDNYEKVQIDNPNGVYSVTVTHKGSLTGGQQPYSLIVSGPQLSLSNENFKLDRAAISIYPNPANDILNLAFNDNIQITNLTVLDITGKVINANFDLNDKSINVSALQSGVYFLRIATENSVVTKKFVKK